MPIFILRKTLFGKFWALSHWTRVYCGSVCVHAVVCTCVYLCAHPCGFTLKHKFFIPFKLASHFYIVFTLISLFSLSERPAMSVGKFSKNLLLPTPLKWWFLIALLFSAFESVSTIGLLISWMSTFPSQLIDYALIVFSSSRISFFFNINLFN